jgi:phage replication-related protein YjqB (UPF0714/DUF867 family)
VVSIGLLNVIENEERKVLTPVAPFGGFVETTTGLVCECADKAPKQKKTGKPTNRTGERILIGTP